MIVQIIKIGIPPYNRVGQILTVDERAGLDLIKKTKQNHFKPIARKISKTEAEKILKQQHADEEKANSISTQIPIRFLVDVFPYRKNEIAVIDREMADELFYEQKAEIVEQTKQKEDKKGK